MARKKMSKEELQDWEELYLYVKNLMNYDENQALSRDMVLRLKGLITGKFLENNNIKDNSNYSYKVILTTFKYCSQSIQKALRTNRFQNEQHKFLYITKIVENNINTVYMKMKNVAKAKEEAANTTIDTTNYIGAEYQRKTKETNNKLLNDLW